jgi:hypothetical protein
VGGYDRSYRQRIVDDYLARSGANFFVPSEFLDWLKDKPGHEAFDLFYGRSDDEAAREWRMMKVRQFVGGLRTTIKVTPSMVESSPHIAVRITEPQTFRLPSYVSPVALRRQGGGYYSADVMEEDNARELYRQAAQGLTSWLERHGDVAKLAGADVEPVQAVLGLLTVAGSPPESTAA